jgi:transcriptional regulator with XRE-family HTH domain
MKMELGKQIRKYRTQFDLSQEEFAEKVFVSRQTISNWENDKSYPDIKSLVSMSEIFHVSLDQLIKGDIEVMRKEINEQEHVAFQRDSLIYTVLFIAVLILPIPLGAWLGWYGLVAYIALIAVAMIFAVRIEIFKKKNDIQTYKEILAFNEGKDLDEIEKNREQAKRPYQKILMAIGSASLALLLCGLMVFLFR